MENGIFSSEIDIYASGYAGEIEAIPKDKAEKIVLLIKGKMEFQLQMNYQKLAKLREQGVLSDSEFQKLKQKLM